MWWQIRPRQVARGCRIQIWESQSFQLRSRIRLLTSRCRSTWNRAEPIVYGSEAKLQTTTGPMTRYLFSFRAASTPSARQLFASVQLRRQPSTWKTVRVVGSADGVGRTTDGALG